MASLLIHEPHKVFKLSWRVCVTVVALLGLVACGQSVVSERVGKQARATGTVDMAKAADFAWTHVRIYTPYSSRDFVCADLSDLAPDCLRKAPVQVPESEYLLVFIDEGTAVGYVRHSRRNGNFQSSTGVLVVRRDAAIWDALPSRSPHQGTAMYLQARVQDRP